MAASEGRGPGPAGPVSGTGSGPGSGAGSGAGLGRRRAGPAGAAPKIGPTGLEVKFCPATGAGGAGPLRLGADGAAIEGYASLWGQADQGGDLVEPGAYGDSLRRLAREGGRVKMLWQHDPASPIGLWDEIAEDGRGLWVKGRILTDLAQGREAALLVAAGAIDGLSIGYRTVQAVREGGLRRLKRLDLWEVSLVTFPMLRTARVAQKAEEAAEEAAADGAEDAALADLARQIAQARQALWPGRRGE